MRILVGCLAFLVLAAPMPQTPLDLHRRYGEPDIERFAIRPDMTMAAEYGPDGKACILEIEPRHAFIHGMVIRQTTISKETAIEVLNDVVPPEMRGKEKVPLFSNVASSSCNGQATFGDYENVQVAIAFGSCEPPIGHSVIGVHSASVRFKRPACDALTK